MSAPRSNSVAGERLKSLIERIERIEEERAALGGDVREVYSEAKGAGFDVRIMRQVVRLRKLEPAERAEMEELLDIYRQAIGMAAGGGDQPSLYAAPVEAAAALFNEGLTVVQVGERLGVSKAEAGKLRQRSDAAGLLTIERGRGRPRAMSQNPASDDAAKRDTRPAPEKVSGISDVSPAGDNSSGDKVSAEKVSGKNHDLPPAPITQEATGGVAHNAAIPKRAGEGADSDPASADASGQSRPPPAKFARPAESAFDSDELAQPEETVAPLRIDTAAGEARLRNMAEKLLADGTATVEFGGKVYGAGNVDEMALDLPEFLDRCRLAGPAEGSA